MTHFFQNFASVCLPSTEKEIVIIVLLSHFMCYNAGPSRTGSLAGVVCSDPMKAAVVDMGRLKFYVNTDLTVYPILCSLTNLGLALHTCVTTPPPPPPPPPHTHTHTHIHTHTHTTHHTHNTFPSDVYMSRKSINFYCHRRRQTKMNSINMCVIISQGVRHQWLK